MGGLSDILLGTMNPQTMTQATEQLKQAEANNFPQYITALADELKDESKQAQVRQLAGIQLKNSFASKDASKRHELEQRWLQLDVNIRNGVKESMMQALGSGIPDVRRTGANVIAKVGSFEIPKGQWPNLTQMLLTAAQGQNQDHKQAALVAVGFLSEDLGLGVIEGTAQVNDQDTGHIMQAIVKNMGDGNEDTKLEATKALFHALILAQNIMNEKSQRDGIMQLVGQNCSSANPAVKKAAYECLVQVATEYYDHLQPYMAGIGTMTFESIRGQDEQVALTALEFWSTICDEEGYLEEMAMDAAERNAQPERHSQHYIRQALGVLVPILTETLTKQQSDDEEETWNLPMAGATCLTLVAQTVCDDVVQPVLQFVNKNFSNPDWRFKEGAIVAYGSIMEGPSTAVLAGVVQGSLEHLLSTLLDPNVAVRDSTAWTIGRICQFHSAGIPVHMMIPTLCKQLAADQPRVAANLCFCLNVMADESPGETGNWAPTTPLSPHFMLMCDTLCTRASKPDALDRNLRTQCYNALSTIVQRAGNDTVPAMEKLAQALMIRLRDALQVVDQEHSELQGMLCAVLMAISTRLPHQTLQNLSKDLMQLYIMVFKHYQAVNKNDQMLLDETMLAISPLVAALGEHFDMFMKEFAPFLGAGLNNFQDVHVCGMCIQLIGDLCRALGKKMAQYCDFIVNVLYQHLKNPAVDQKLKPLIMICFGDIALAIEGGFEHYMAAGKSVMPVLVEASRLRKSDGGNDPSEEWLEYLNTLRDAVLEAYTGIIHGLKAAGKTELFKSHVNEVLGFIAICVEEGSSDQVLKSCVGVIGDLITCYQTELAGYIAQAPWLGHLVTFCQKGDPDTVAVGRYLERSLGKFSHGVVR